MLEVVHENLPMDGRTWRVEWYGPLRRNPASPLEFQLSIYFRKMGVGPSRPPLPEVREVSVGSGVLCSLPLGSLWSDGRMVGYGEFESIECRIDFSRIQTTDLTRAASGTSLSIREYGSLLVPSEARKATLLVGGIEREAKAAATKRSAAQTPTRGPQVVIPLFEVARAWFLRDSLLTLQLLSAPLSVVLERLHDSAQTRMEGGRLHLALRPGVNASIVPILAMLLRHEYARDQAQGMLRRITADHLSQTSPRIAAYPPIEGVSTIHAVGEWQAIKSRNVFFVYWLTAVELPTLPPITWFRSEPEVSTELGDDANYVVADPTPVREIVRVVHSQEPSTREAAVSIFARGATLLNLPDIERRSTYEGVRPCDVVRVPTDTTLSVSPSTVVSSGLERTWREGVAPARYVTQLAEGPHDSDRCFLPAGFEQAMRVASIVAADSEMSIGSTTGAFYLDHISGFRRTLLGSYPRWAQIHGRPRQALCVEIVWQDRHYYFFELERRTVKEEVSACLLGRSDGGRFTSADVDRILAACAKNRGSWRSVHEPFWYRTLAHKFKDEHSFSARLRTLIRDRHQRPAVSIQADGSLEPDEQSSGD